VIDTDDIDVYLGLGVGKGEQHATALTPDGWPRMCRGGPCCACRCSSRAVRALRAGKDRRTSGAASSACRSRSRGQLPARPERV